GALRRGAVLRVTEDTGFVLANGLVGTAASFNIVQCTGLLEGATASVRCRCDREGLDDEHDSRPEHADTALLLDAAWRNWPVETVTDHVRTIMSGSPADIAAVAQDLREKGTI
ncbi:MAG TPA: hypothetical protein VHG10_04265, partial [Glycomyces sp.]|nr:hypothetical protein [Glycomyces sp.]